MNIWDIVFLEPLLNGLVVFYKLFGNLGLAIIGFTVLVRFLLIPLTLPSLKAAQKMRDLAPHIERLKLRHKNDRTKFTQAQMDLFKQHGVNPVAGCLPQIVQIVILIALFQAFFRVLSADSSSTAKINEFLWGPLLLPEGMTLDTKFLYLDLLKPDVIHMPGLPLPLPGIFLLLSGAVQFISSKMMLPARSRYASSVAGGPQVSKEAKIAEKTKTQTDDMMVSMQRSMMWLFPVTTVIIGFGFPSGLVLYWFVFSAFQVVQQYMTSGWGGLAPEATKLKQLITLLKAR